MIDGLNAYSEYRDTAQPWLGAAPAHWAIQRAKYVLREIDNRWANKNGTLLSVSQYTGVTKRRLREGSDEPATRSATLEGYKVVAANDLAVNIMLAWNGSLGVSPFEGVVSPAYCVYRFRFGDPLFFHHLLRSPDYRSEIKRRSRGVVESRLRLYSDDLFRIPFLIPPLAEQAAIVRFLGAVDRKVNRFVRAKRRLIEVLTEQKQAIITDAVTGGLNPNAPRRHSGIEWLGEVPEHWEVVPLRRRSDIIDCKHLTVEFVEDGIPLASVREVQTFDLSLAKAKRTTTDWYQKLIEGDRRPRRGDIIYCRNVSVGAAAIVNTDDPCAMGQDVCLIRSKENPRYVNYFLHSALMDRQLSMVLVGSTFDRINVAEVKALTVVLPPKKEQDAIATYLDEAMQSFESAIAVIKREIDLIREYRTRLVADVVTGKLDVRAVAAHISDDVVGSESPVVPDETTESDVEIDEEIVRVGEESES